jgi:small conductance mechanosensitive channel
MIDTQQYTKYFDMAINYASEYSFKIIGAIAIFIIGRWFVKKITLLFKQLMLKSQLDITLIEFSQSILYFILLLAVIVASLNTLGIATTSFVAVFGAVGLSVGLALQDSLANIGAAVLIMFFRPFKIGDTVEVAGAMGTVGDINLFSTTITPIDNRTIIIPNAKIVADKITNFSKQEQRRLDIVIGISYEDDLKVAKNVLLSLLQNNEKIIQDPEPFVGVFNLGQSGVDLAIRAWVKTEEYADMRFEVLEEIKLACDANGISIPYPQIDLHHKNPIHS